MKDGWRMKDIDDMDACWYFRVLSYKAKEVEKEQNIAGASVMEALGI